jgi:hypothetical protein
LREQRGGEDDQAINLYVDAAVKGRAGAQKHRGAKDGVGGAIGFVVGCCLAIEVVPVLDGTGSDAEEGEDQEDGCEAAQAK